MQDFIYNSDSPCESCPFQCGESLIICNRLRYFTQALKVSNLQPQECEPFMPVIDKYNRESFERLQNINDNIDEFVSEGNNLLIMGVPGVGKTSFAIKLMLNYLNYLCKYKLKSKVCRYNEDGTQLQSCVYMVRANDIYSTMFDYEKYEELRKHVESAYVVTFDDICTRSMTEAMRTRLLELIDMRMSTRKTTIYTTNEDSDGIKEKLADGRLLSRIAYKLTSIGFDERCIDRRVQEVSKW